MTTTKDRPKRRARIPAWTLPIGVPLLLVVVLVALLSTSAWFWSNGRSDEGQPAAVTAGRTAAVTFFSLDHDHPGANIEKLLRSSTGSFRSEYAAQRSRLEKEVQSKQLAVTAKVADNGTAVEFFSARRAQVLVAVDTTTTLPGGRSEKASYRTRVVLSRVGERWLVAGLEQVG
jgi:Mce-associated membrane protein